MVLILDNYDSFTYNLVQTIAALRPGNDIQVIRNDAVSIDAIASLDASHILISPGPGRPSDAGISVSLIRALAGKVPILGVCLGLQCICEAFGGHVVPARRVVHGKASEMYHDGQSIYRDVPNPFRAARYHSLVAERATLPSDFDVSAWTADGEIMGIRHREMSLEGVQFHPESFLSENGPKLLGNFFADLRPPANLMSEQAKPTHFDGLFQSH